jgi:hypothetical protein
MFRATSKYVHMSRLVFTGNLAGSNPRLSSVDVLGQKRSLPNRTGLLLLVAESFRRTKLTLAGNKGCVAPDRLG